MVEEEGAHSCEMLHVCKACVGLCASLGETHGSSTPRGVSESLQTTKIVPLAGLCVINSGGQNPGRGECQVRKYTALDKSKSSHSS